MGSGWPLFVLLNLILKIVFCNEHFINEETGIEWVIPNVNYADPDDNVVKTTTEIIKSQNFPVEKHFIQTEDGYILALHRIPSKGIPVLMIHGFLSSSDEWIYRNNSNNDLPFILSKAGFDVWLGNLRGNTYSRNHITLSPKQYGFWKFSLHEHGFYDFPAMIELIRHKTGRKKVIFIGYSFGGAPPYILSSTRPEYKKYIELNILLAPFVFGTLDRRSSLITYVLGPVTDFIINSRLNSQRMSDAELGSRTKESYSLYSTLCCRSCMGHAICKMLVQEIVGYDKTMDLSDIVGIALHVSTGTSIMALHQTREIFKTNQFLVYDINAPITKRIDYTKEYNVSAMTIPTMIWYAKNDWLVDEKAIMKLAKLTPNIVHLNLIPDKNINHYVYWIHNKSNELVSNKLMKQLREYLETTIKLPP